MHHVAVCRHASDFPSEQRILSGQSALYVEAVHEPDQYADAPYAAYQILACFKDVVMHVVMLSVQSITQGCTSADVPFAPVPRPYNLCTWSLVPDSPEVLMVEDLQQDAR